MSIPPRDNIEILERHHDAAERAYCDALAVASDPFLPAEKFERAEAWRQACDNASRCAWDVVQLAIREAVGNG